MKEFEPVVWWTVFQKAHELENMPPHVKKSLKEAIATWMYDEMNVKAKDVMRLLRIRERTIKHYRERMDEFPAPIRKAFFEYLRNFKPSKPLQSRTAFASDDSNEQLGYETPNGKTWVEAGNEEQVQAL